MNKINNFGSIYGAAEINCIMVATMTDTYNITIPAQARDVAAMATELFGERLCGVYLYGSAVLGGLRPDSDVDILIIIDGGLDDTLRAELTKRLLKLSVTVEAAHSEQRGLRPLEITVLDSNQLRPAVSRRKSNISTANGCGTKSKPASCRCHTRAPTL